MRQSIGRWMAVGLLACTVSGFTPPGVQEPPWQALFDLDIVAPQQLAPGSDYRPVVFVRGSYDDQPIAGIEVEGRWTLGDRHVGTTLARTNAEGQAHFAWVVPPNVPDDGEDATFRATVRRGGWERSLESWLSVEAWQHCTLTSDKRLFQPGQTAHFRARCLNNHIAWANRDVTFTVTRDRRVVWRTAGVTSRFGIASGQWAIPETAEEGDYQLSVAADGYPYAMSRTELEVARYERASILLSAEVAGPVLPGQQGRVLVTVKTPDGRPVPGASIRLFEADRDADAVPETSGKTGADGTVGLLVDMAAMHAWLTKDPDHSWRYQWRDLVYTLAAVDPLTERVERLNVTVRAVLAPLLIAVEQDGVATEHGGHLLVRTQDAHGDPAPCHVRVMAFEPAADDAALGASLAARSTWFDALVAAGAPMVTTTTDRYGTGRVWLDAATLRAINEAGNLLVEAVDDQGRTTVVRSGFRVDQEPIAIEAQTTLRAAGEPMALVIASDAARTVTLEVSRRSTMLVRKTLTVSAGRTPVGLPYQSEFEGLLLVGLWSLVDGTLQQGDTTVAYAHDDGLGLQITSERVRYRPGEQARLRLAVTDRAGRGVPSAVGLGVVDRTIEARQHQRLGLGPPLLDDHRSRLAGWTVGRLLDPALRADQRAALDPMARMLLYAGGSWRTWDSVRPVGEERRLYGDYFEDRFSPWGKILNTALKDEPYRTTFDPAWVASLLERNHIQVARYVDPWGQPMRLETTLKGAVVHMKLHSASRDRRWGTRDDFVVWSHQWYYFAPLAKTLTRFVEAQFSAGQYPEAGEGTFERAMDRAGIDPVPRDPWGGRYAITTAPGWRGSVQVAVHSKGPDGVPDPPAERSSRGGNTSADATVRDDVRMWGFTLRLGDRYIERALHCLRDVGLRPGLDVRAALARCGETPTRWLDAHGTPVMFRIRDDERYSVADSYDGATGMNLSEGVTEHLRRLEVISHGADRVAGTEDDLVIGQIVEPRVQRRADGHTEEAPPGVRLAGDTGALVVTVSDETGAALAGVTVRVAPTHSQGDVDADIVQVTDDDGRVSARLARGVYALTLQLDGFATVEYPTVRVRAGRVTVLNVALHPSIEETITVTSESPLLDDRKISIGASIGHHNTSRRSVPGDPGLEDGPRPARRLVPRLRRQFPETLAWHPEIVVDEDGTAEVVVPLADNITTWHVAAQASTVDGRWATAEHEMRVDLPLFVEPDVPPTVTEGDVLSVPTFVHNLGEAPRRVAWNAGLVTGGQRRGRTKVEAGAAARVRSSVRFKRPGRATFEVEAHSTDALEPVADHIQRPVQVRFAGRPRRHTLARLVTEDGALTINVPAEALPGSARLRVKAYTTPAAHFGDALAAMARQPTGCTEQTLSAAFPALLLLEHAGDALAPARSERLHEILHAAVATLRQRQTATGGFAFWSRGDADAALTAYAVSFLARVRPFVEIDDARLGQAVAWLVSAQGADGRWRARGDDGAIDLRTVGTTARVASSLASLVAEDPWATTVRGPIERALAFLAPKRAVVAAPGALADVIIAAQALGDATRVAPAVDHLRSLATTDEAGLHRWRPASSTPFFGWGRTGTIETTGRVVQSLLAAGVSVGSDAVVDGGLAYLLTTTDGDGWWGSTQATTQALTALAAALGVADTGGPDADGPDDVEMSVWLDDTLMPPEQVAEPAVDASLPRQFVPTAALASQEHTVRLEGWNANRPTLVVATLDFHTPWYPAPPVPDEARNLRFDVSCDAETSLRVGTPVRCAVAVERVGRGGMLIASIGLPPGAEVDRTALDQLVARRHGVSHYDVKPDRVLVYLWTRAGGNHFDVVWRPRLAMRAQSASSSLYDYYQPAARIERPPQRFVVAE